MGGGSVKFCAARMLLLNSYRVPLQKICITGTFTNTQIRTALSSALETGMRDIEIRAITGPRS